MYKSLAILGRQPALGLAELERLYGPDGILPTATAEAVQLEPSVDQIAFERLGGTVKLAKLLTELPTTDWTELVKYLVDSLPQHVGYIPEGKIRLGLSTYGLRVGLPQINRAGLELKRVVKNTGRSVRVVPNTAPALNSAQTLHNQLTGPTGMELALVRNGAKTLLVQVIRVQNIDAYSARDQARPKRDARVGMLPPKLAQILVNLSGAQPGDTVLDPFCGTGVVLQEALLMGCKAYGSDLEPRMIEYSQQNLDWLGLKHSFEPPVLEIADATNQQWSWPYKTVATETYLGRAFSAPPAPDQLKQVISDVNVIHKKFLHNLAKQTQKGLTLCLAVPAWKTSSGFKHLPTLDSLEELGYTRWSFAHVRNEDLVYHREGQIVGRELVVLTRK